MKWAELIWDEILGNLTIVQGQPHAKSSQVSRAMSKGADPQDGKSIPMGTIPDHRVKWEMISKGMILRRSLVEGHQSKQGRMFWSVPNASRVV